MQCTKKEKGKIRKEECFDIDNKKQKNNNKKIVQSKTEKLKLSKYNPLLLRPFFKMVFSNLII